VTPERAVTPHASSLQSEVSAHSTPAAFVDIQLIILLLIMLAIAFGPYEGG
jgi:hypothetical protein